MSTSTIHAPREGISEAMAAVLVQREHPARIGAVGASLAHAWRGMRKMRHYAIATLMEVSFMPIITLVTITYLFGGAFSGSTGEYLQYVLPGIMVQAVVIVTVWTGTMLNVDITKGIYDRFRAMPFWQPSTVVGNLLSDLPRYFVAVSITIPVGLLMGFRPDGGALGMFLAVLVLVVFASSVSWIFAALGVVAGRPETISSSSMMVLFPLIYTSNIFAQPETMPGWLEAIVKVNPISVATTAARGLTHGNATGGQIAALLLLCAVITGIFAPLTMHLYRSKGAR
ncbi:ABC transporter permease [Streptomyces griseus]|uniref:ABC transporter permease n=1 Tax=Streptomyces griseus TaxID=1911 RepID=UPI0005609FA1|nr:ABC transporter permease [Streptomyces griseus]